MIISCTSCGKQDQHKIVYMEQAIVHLRCSDCGAVSAVVLEKPAEEGKGVNELKLEPLDYTALMERRGSRKPLTYSINGVFADGQYINHPKFGEGYVLAMQSPPFMMEVLFKDQKRMLVCGSSSFVGMREDEEQQSSEVEVVRQTEPSRVVQAERKSGASAGDGVAYSSDKEIAKCPVCGHTIHPYNLVRAPGGRIVGCMRCK